VSDVVGQSHTTTISINKNSIGFLVAGGFLFGIGSGKIVPVAGVFAAVGLVLMVLGLLAMFGAISLDYKQPSRKNSRRRD
jgi:hypothetical protein